ncbi:MAG TPA: carbon starvation CstA family protein [Ignavibacteria bacterium]|jgi:carbon starvation protein
MIALVIIICLLLFIAAYFIYSRAISKIYKLDCEAKTPATEINDGVDYIPTNKWYLLAQHFSAISAAGPIFGPIIAALAFGWLPALLWIVLGNIFIGAVHDFSTLVGSVKHKAKSVAEVVKEYTGTKAYFFFISYIWLALIYVLTAFTDVTARAFVNNVQVKDGAGNVIDTVIGAGTATSSILYLSLAVLLGIALKLAESKIRNLKTQTILKRFLITLFILLIGVIIIVGQKFPVSIPALSSILGTGNSILAYLEPTSTWNFVILIYCGIASVLPMWLLLQPRGFLGGAFLYIILIAGIVGIFIGSAQNNISLNFTTFSGFSNERLGPLFPVLFITIACGACSGFHGIVCSGTTSKQLKSECDAPLIGYGGMLLEGVIALISLSTVMILLPSDFRSTPDTVFALGIGKFISQIGIPYNFAISFGMLAFATFVFDTIDVTTRLGRYLVQELFGFSENKGKVLATFLTLLIPAVLLSTSMISPDGKPIPSYMAVWPVFGASNQLLAALSLVGLFSWVRKLNKGYKEEIIVGIPMVFMTIMTLWALFLNIKGWIDSINAGTRTIADPVGLLSIALVILAISLIYLTLQENYKVKYS